MIMLLAAVGCRVENSKETQSQGADNEYVVESAQTNVGSATAQAWLELPAERTDGRYPQAAAYTVEVDGERNYTHYYDADTYTSLWVAYPIEAKHMGSCKRPSRWTYNPLISSSKQVDLCSHSYKDGYARGHLIPNASRNGNLDMQLQTFYVTNSVPQVQAGFNGGVWKNLEAAVQDLAEQQVVYVVSGVAFEKEGENKTISYTMAKDDTKQVPVPNYFYKLVLKVDTNSAGEVVDASTVGFWFENRGYSDSYTNHTVSVDQVEAWTGFDYFANLPDNIEAQAERNASWTTFVRY